MIGGFVALAGLILYQANATRADIRDLRAEVSELGERVTRIETRLEYAPPGQPEPSPVPSPPD